MFSFNFFKFTLLLPPLGDRQGIKYHKSYARFNYQIKVNHIDISNPQNRWVGLLFTYAVDISDGASTRIESY